jgi:hypothetical protein
MLIVARERHEDRITALTNLLDALEIMQNTKAVDWVYTCKTEWYLHNDKINALEAVELNCAEMMIR